MNPESQAPNRRSQLLLFIWGAAVVYTVTLAYVSHQIAGFRPLGRFELMQEIVLLAFWAAGTPFIIWSAGRWPLERPRSRAIARHLLLGTGFILSINVAAPFLTALLLGAPFDPRAIWHLGLLQFVSVFHLAAIVYAFILGVGLYLRAVAARRTEEFRAERLRADLAEARLRALQLQLEPHMLFNALNAAVHWCSPTEKPRLNLRARPLRSRLLTRTAHPILPGCGSEP